jgi:hypothetical protein
MKIARNCRTNLDGLAVMLSLVGQPPDWKKRLNVRLVYQGALAS